MARQIMNANTVVLCSSMKKEKNMFTQRLHIVHAARKGRLNSHLLTIPRKSTTDTL